MALLWVAAVQTADAQTTAGRPEARLSLGVEWFDWEEYRGALRLLEEKGPRFTVGLRNDNFHRPSPGGIHALQGRLYFGEVDYDGQTQSAIAAYHGLPLQADTVYLGALGEALVGQRFGGRRALDLLAGVGVNNWVREIQASQTTSGNTIVYTGDAVEHYFILYAKLGLGAYRAGANGYLHFQIGAKYPFYTYEYVDDVDLTLEPGHEWSAYAQLRFSGFAASGLALTFYYDSFRFSQSPAERFTRDGLDYIGFQPESHMDVIGANAEFRF